MKDSIYTIPLSEVFEPKDGCPICRLRDTLEQRCVEYIMGAAMMEPDIRIETNHTGFCHRHFNRMLQQKNRLALALMLESHLAEIRDEVLPTAGAGRGFLAKKPAEKRVTERCYICEKVDWALDMMLGNLLALWRRDPAFRTLFSEQPCLCLEHFLLLADRAPGALKKEAPAFLAESRRLTEAYLAPLQQDVTHFCRMFDYRSRGEDFGTSRDAVERAVWYLTSRKPD